MDLLANHTAYRGRLARRNSPTNAPYFCGHTSVAMENLARSCALYEIARDRRGSVDYVEWTEHRRFRLPYTDPGSATHAAQGVEDVRRRLRLQRFHLFCFQHRNFSWVYTHDERRPVLGIQIRTCRHRTSAPPIDVSYRKERRNVVGQLCHHSRHAQRSGNSAAYIAGSPLHIQPGRLQPR